MKKDKKVIRKEEFYWVKICRLVRDLPFFTVKPGVKIAIFNILGDVELVRRVAAYLAKRIPKNVQVLVTPEVKSIPLAYELAKRLNKPYVVARKALKPYMVGSVGVEVLSITTGKPQKIWLDGKDLSILKNKRVALVDDVISTGSTMVGLKQLMRKAKAKVVTQVAVFTEGNKKRNPNIICVGNLPIW